MRRPSRSRRVRSSQQAVVARAFDRGAETQLLEIFEGILGDDLGAGRHIEPIDEAGQHEPQGRAAREYRQRVQFGRVVARSAHTRARPDAMMIAIPNPFAGSGKSPNSRRPSAAAETISK